jgi:hypothetical protein
MGQNQSQCLEVLGQFFMLMECTQIGMFIVVKPVSQVKMETMIKFALKCHRYVGIILVILFCTLQIIIYT